VQVSLQTLRKHLSRIHHDLNNPLSIVSGNLQLLKELSKALDVEENFEGPLKDIAAALEQLSDTTEQLIVVRNILQQLDES